MNGWIKLYRELLHKTIWLNSTAEQKAILITILLLASHTENVWEWQGQRYTVEPGQLVTSLPSLAKAAGVTVQNVRSALKRFKKYGFLTDKSTAKGRLVTIANWDVYQSLSLNPTAPSTVCKQTANSLLTDCPTAIKKVKKDEKYKEEILIIVDYLNEKTGKSFKGGAKSTVSHINARLTESFTVEDFKAVIDQKVSDWANDPKMSEYLRPATLFGPKFESYLNARSAGDSLKQPTERRGYYI